MPELPVPEIQKARPAPLIVKPGSKSKDIELLDIGREEKELLRIAQEMKGRIADSTWNEIALQAGESSYTVKDGDWLWKISEKFFGSGFYAPKIWAINSYITNPHMIEPGMVLIFTTGTEAELPQVSVKEQNPSTTPGAQSSDELLAASGERPDWMVERKKLMEEGAFVQYSTGDTLEDLKRIGEKTLNEQYKDYSPPSPEFNFVIPTDEYDKLGFDRSSRVRAAFKSSEFINTFVSMNIVQDFGEVAAAIAPKKFFVEEDTIFLKFDKEMNISVGDKFSIYDRMGKVETDFSDREGFAYTILGGVEIVQRHKDRWEAKIIESTGSIRRGDRLTVYTPEIPKPEPSFSNQLIEAMILKSYLGTELLSYADVVYLDRGRNDGVELGNVFEVFGFEDRGTDKKITSVPTYKNGELQIVNLTDNFSTALVTLSIRDFKVGDLAVSKTKAKALQENKISAQLAKNAKTLKSKELDNLDVELNLDNLSDDILDKAEEIKYTEDELAELERQERSKSILSESEKDIRDLERLESEITTAEAMLNEARMDEDKLLESENLNRIEETVDAGYEESLEELEENFGKLYLDEELNDKENPYGLTEFDIEEIDELLNVEGELDQNPEVKAENDVVLENLESEEAAPAPQIENENNDATEAPSDGDTVEDLLLDEDF